MIASFDCRLIHYFIVIFQANADDDKRYVKEDEDEDVGEETWQAEEATERPTSALTQMKWMNYGTKSRVEESRRKHFSEAKSARKYSDQKTLHLISAMTEA